jgi:hypothetical protein
MKLRRSTGLLAGLLTFGLLAAGQASAAPVTVQLRIEGPTHTLFEGPVTTDVRPFHFTTGADTADHTCNGTAANQGTSPTPAATRGAVVAAAPVSTSGDWFDSLGSPSFATIGGESVAFDPATNRFLVEYKNAQPASVGSCADPVQNGDDVLFAYGDGSEQLLELSGPAGAAPGQTVRVRVTDAQSGAAVAGAAVAGTTTAADGSATVGPLHPGDNAFKASKSGTIRSNAVHVCATNGSDGACGTKVPPPAQCATNGHDGLCGTGDTTAPTVRLLKAYDHWYYSRRHAPRTLRGIASQDPSGIKDVRVRLKRRVGKRCWSYSAGKERFVRRSCKRDASYFSVGDQPSWSYLLPFRLRAGRYTLDAKVIDKAGNTSPLKRGRNRVVFHVL